MTKTKKPAEITLETIVQRDPGQEFSLIDDEVVMLSLNTGEYYAMNSVASRIWQILEERRTVREVTAILKEEFEVDDKTCMEDTLECLYDFREKSLITEQ